MKLEKVTQKEKTAEKRWYDDACGTALALEFVGERWSLLVIRELMYGPRRFSEIKANLPGVSANVLTQRLEGLEAGGILVKRKLPSTASVQVYELTPWGLEVEPIFIAMGQWAIRSMRHDPTLFLSPASCMMSFRTMIDRALAKPVRMTVAFRFPTDSFVGEIAGGEIVIHRGETDQADVTFITDTTTMAFTVYGKVPFEVHESIGKLAIEGDRAAAETFVTLFNLPGKIAD